MHHLFQSGSIVRESPEAYTVRANLLFITGDATGGIASAMRATTIDPNFAGAWIELGQMFAATEQPDPPGTSNSQNPSAGWPLIPAGESLVCPHSLRYDCVAGRLGIWEAKGVSR